MPTRRNGEEPESGVPPIGPCQARDLLPQGYLVLDVRSPGAYGQGHIRGALNVYFRGHQFAERVAKVTAPAAHIVLVVEVSSEAETVAERLGGVGRQNVTGYLTGDPPAWQEAGLPISRVEQIPARVLQEKGEIQVLDVREPDEWKAGHIPGALHIPYDELDQRTGELDPDRTVAAYCSSGQRSSTATSILEQHGFRDVANVEGGFSEWRRAGYEYMGEERPSPTATRVEDLGYGFKVQVDLPFEEALRKVRAAIRAEGMQIVVQADFQKVLRETLGLPFRRYRVLGVSDAELVYDALQAVPEIGLFMPCNVLVYETDGGSVIATVNPDAIVGMVRHAALGDCASGMRAKLEMVLQRVRQHRLPT